MPAAGSGGGDWTPTGVTTTAHPEDPVTGGGPAAGKSAYSVRARSNAGVSSSGASHDRVRRTGERRMPPG